jgi:hypothetical protein
MKRNARTGPSSCSVSGADRAAMASIRELVAATERR